MATISSNAEINSVRLKEQGSNPSTPATGYGQLYIKTDGVYFIDDAGTVTGPLVDSGGAGGGYTEGARVYKSTNTTIAHNTGTKVTFDTERYDTDTIHDTGTNTERLTCTTAGKYVISANIEFAANSTGLRQMRIKLNDTTYIGNSNIDTPSGTVVCRMSITTIYDLSATDYVELEVYQSSGGNLTLNSTANVSPEFMMQRIG